MVREGGAVASTPSGAMLTPCGPGALRFEQGYASLPAALVAALPAQVSVMTSAAASAISEGTSSGSSGAGAGAVTDGGSGGGGAGGGTAISSAEDAADADSSNSIVVQYRHSNGTLASMSAKRVVVAVPPAVAADSIAFTPQLPAAKARMMQSTATWCGDWCKVVANFRTSFWRAKGIYTCSTTPSPCLLFGTNSLFFLVLFGFVLQKCFLCFFIYILSLP